MEGEEGVLAIKLRILADPAKILGTAFPNFEFRIIRLF
jgi:hypothetical protein